MVDLHVFRDEELRPLTRREYDRLVEMGCFEDERIELLAGFLVAKEPQGAYHSDLLSTLADKLRDALRGRARVRVQCPFAASPESEPEPDIAVVPNGDYRGALPSKAPLVIEVAGSSSKRDRTLKAAIYARADVQEYWVVDLKGRVTHVFRDPIPGIRRPARIHGKRKTSVLRLSADPRQRGTWTRATRVPWTDALSPLAFPDVVLRLADFG